MLNSMNSTITGITVARKQIETAMNNIANETTPGYKKRSLVVSEVRQAGVAEGRGVRIDGISRNVDEGLNRNIYEANGKYQFVEEQRAMLEPLHRTLDEGLLGVDTFRQVEEALEQLRNIPADTSFREELKGKVELFANQANQTLTAIDAANEKAMQEVHDSVEDINRIVEDIAYLNNSIDSVGEMVALEMKDKRDNLEKELSQYVKFTAHHDEREYKLELDGADTPLIYRSTFKQLGVEESVAIRKFESNQGNPYEYTMQTATIKMHVYGGNVGSGTDIDLSNSRLGKLNAQLQYVDAGINDPTDPYSNNTHIINSDGAYGSPKNELEEFKLMAMSFLANIRDDIDSVPNDSNNTMKMFGIDFMKTGGLESDGTTSTGESVMEGDYITVSGSEQFEKIDTTMINEIMLTTMQDETASLFSISGELNIEEQENLIGTTLDMWYNNKQANVFSENSVLEVFEEEYQRVSMVDKTEQMIDVMKFQAAYQAGAKMIQVIDELIQTTLDMKR